MEKIEKMTIEVNSEVALTIKELARANGVPVDDIVNGLLSFAILQGRNFDQFAVSFDGAERTD